MTSQNNERLRPERGDGVKRRGAAPPSESAWGWGPTRSDKCGLSRAMRLVVLAMSLVVISACRQDMHNQPKSRGLRPSTFFADGSSARPLVEGTVARGTLQEDEAFFTGKVANVAVTELPFVVDEAVLNRGQETSIFFARRAMTAPAAGRAWSSSGATVPPPRSTSIGCARRTPGTSSTS